MHYLFQIQDGTSTISRNSSQVGYNTLSNLISPESKLFSDYNCNIMLSKLNSYFYLKLFTEFIFHFNYFLFIKFIFNFQTTSCNEWNNWGVDCNTRWFFSLFTYGAIPKWRPPKMLIFRSPFPLWTKFCILILKWDVRLFYSFSETLPPCIILGHP